MNDEAYGYKGQYVPCKLNDTRGEKVPYCIPSYTSESHIHPFNQSLQCIILYTS